MKPKPLNRTEVASLLSFVYGADHLHDEMVSVEALLSLGPSLSVWVSPTGAYHVGSGAPNDWTEVAIITQSSIQQPGAPT